MTPKQPKAPKRLAPLAALLELRGCSVRVRRHLMIKSPSGYSFTIAGSPSVSNRRQVIADLKRAEIDTDDDRLIRAVNRGTKG